MASPPPLANSLLLPSTRGLLLLIDSLLPPSPHPSLDEWSPPSLDSLLPPSPHPSLNEWSPPYLDSLLPPSPHPSLNEWSPPSLDKLFPPSLNELPPPSLTLP